MIRKLKLALLPAMLMLFAGVGFADTFDGMTYTLSVGSTPTTTVVNGTTYYIYDVFLSFNTTGFTAPKGTAPDYIPTVSITLGAGNSLNFSLSSLVSAPGPAGSWTFNNGGQNSSSCDGSGNGFICAQDSTTAKIDGSSYTWEFHYASSTKLDPSFSGSHVKADVVDSTGTFVDQLSKDTTVTSCTTNCEEPPPPSVPEPTSITLLGSALLLTVGTIRRQMRKV